MAPHGGRLAAFGVADPAVSACCLLGAAPPSLSGPDLGALGGGHADWLSSRFELWLRCGSLCVAECSRLQVEHVKVGSAKQCHDGA